MADIAGRDAWVARMLPRLLDTVADPRLPDDERYTEDECRELLEYVYGLDVDAPAGDLTPPRQIMAKILQMQGWDAAAIFIGARLLDKLHWGRMEVNQPAAASIIGIHRVTLMRAREEGHLRVKSRQVGPDYDAGATYWLADLLYLLRWRSVHPRTGGIVPGYPPSSVWRG